MIQLVKAITGTFSERSDVPNEYDALGAVTRRTLLRKTYTLIFRQPNDLVR